MQGAVLGTEESGTQQMSALLQGDRGFPNTGEGGVGISCPG